MDSFENDDLAYVMQAIEDNPDAEFISVMESPATMMTRDFVVNQNSNLMDSNAAIRQEMDDLALFSAAYNEQNGQRSLQTAQENTTADIPMMESPGLMSNEVLSQMQAEVDDPNVDPRLITECINQIDDVMDINDATQQDLQDLMTDNGNGQPRYGEFVGNQEQNIVVPTIIVNTQHVLAIMQNAGIQIGEAEYLVDLEDGVASFAPIEEMINGGNVF